MKVIDKEFNSSISVLVVDDNTDLASITGMLLDLLGFRVQTCHSGKDCIMLMDSVNPDVVLMDLEMPAMDGYEACSQIRSAAWGSKVGIIAYSGRDSDQSKNRVRSSGFDGFVSKPASYETLWLTITTLVAQSRSR